MKVFKTATLKVRNTAYTKWMRENAEELLKQGKTMNEIKDLAKEATGSSGEFESFPALRGETSYDIAVANGYKGTQEDWLNMMTDENGWITRYSELDSAKADKATTYTAGQVDELLKGIIRDYEENIDTGSYHAFIAAVNEDTVSAAFGKNNEDMIKGVGRQLAMYAWFKGEDKDDYPFTNLKSMSTLKDMNHYIFTEIINSDPITELVLSNTYARDKIFEALSAPKFGDGQSETVTVTVTEDELSTPFRIWYSVDSNNDAFDMTITINGKIYDTFHCGQDVEREELCDPLSWKAFNITEPGTYDIVGSIPDINTTYGLAGQFTVYKSKPSYAVEAE